MYLKTIELCGFKSFAEKTRLEFDRRLTAIVGPNGCGKSNIVDAVRWCLGEQSAHSLRSSQMSSIIFNGSQTRSPLGLAEVTLIFDNSSNIIPVGYSEVSITRKLFRSGESEYYINGTQCRLKDIRDMFLDTGIGREGYSIFEQGKVELITNAKPEERRALFEEAAGVAKFNVRREETLRKLEKVRQDMDRVNDIMSVLKEQINSLESAVKKARLFQKYQEELKTLEVASFVKRINALSSEIQPIGASTDELNKKLLEKNTSTNTMEADMSNLRVELAISEKQLREIHQQINKIDREIAHSEEKIKHSTEMASEFRQRQDTLKKNVRDFGDMSVSLNENAERIKSELANSGETHRKLNETDDTLKAELEKIREGTSGTQSKINTLNNAIMELVHKKSDRNNETSRHNSAMTYLSQNINRQAKELQKAREERTVLENDLRTLESAIDSVKAGIRETDERLENIINASNELKKKHQEQTEKYLTLKSKTDVLKDIRQKDPKLRAIYSILTKNMPGIHGTVSGILKISPYHTDVVQNILGEKLNYLVCSTMNDALAAIEYLEKNNLGWATLIILENLPDIEDKTPVAHLRGEKPALSVVSYDKKWEKLLKFLLSNTYFTGNLSFSEGMVRGGSAGGTQPAEISLKEIQQVENELKNSEDELKILEGEIAASENTREELNRQSQELKLELNAKISEVKNKTEKFYITNVEIETINSEIENFKKDELENTRGLELLQSEVLAVDNSINSVQSELAQLKNSLDVLTKEESVVHQRFIESTKEFSGFESLMNSYRRELENVLLNLKNYEGQAHSSSGEIETLDKKTLEQQQIHEEETKKINACYENKSEIEKKLQEYQSENTRLSSRIEAKQGNLTCLRTEMDDLKENIHVLEIQQKTKELEMKSVTGSLQELGISFDEAKDTYLNIEVDDEQVKRLRQRILNMGNVNLAAQEEYSNLDERYNFLLNQQQDLLKAEEDLRNAINKINVSIRDDFKNTFEKVRENFKTVFSMLFEGGEADLLLTDHENLLECGIEIVVQPPGKKPQNISLSGGEKALTAIALLFAFFMVKPSPVCILDEVDAPLDTSNIVRFINLVKLYVENSQFLLITHNNRTMEAADILYGITMEEYGISKTISMRLHKQKEESPVSGRETIPGAVNA